MKEKDTPLNRQYSQIKAKYPETILLFRMGDFFETFNEDAVTTSKVCGITLTKRNNGAAGEVPLAGFPHHQLDNYLPKLVRAGLRVAVCEQLEDPKLSRGIVRRGVVEVVTPGVALYDKLLDTKRNNYVLALMLKEKKNEKAIGLACADISTGEFFVAELEINGLVQVLETLLPSEVIISKSQKTEFEQLLSKLSFKPSLTRLEPWIFDIEFGREALQGHFKTHNLKGFGIDELTVAIASAGAILHYIKETQNGELSQIVKISSFNPNEYMNLDYSTRRNLEITYSMYEGTIEGSLISILDKTSTAMGGRLLKKWVTRPLLNLEQIQLRQGAVEALYKDDTTRTNLKNILSEIADLERLISKVCTARANPRDVVSLKNSLKKTPEIKSCLHKIDCKNLIRLADLLNPLEELVKTMEDSIIEEPSVQMGTGNIFKQGLSAELDEYIDAKHSGKKWIAKYQETERASSGISTLKVGYTSVFGYYIEITRTHKDKIPAGYERKQTLTNAERYITPELKEIESKILNAEEKILTLEQTLFNQLLQKIAVHTQEIQENANRISQLDTILSFAEISKQYNYCKPQIDESDIIEIVDGRHPVVERLLPIGEKFSPNSTSIDSKKELIHIITGPNMSGKSCYLRQVGLIILLGQIGCFVPAKSAHFGVVDRIFTRVGAQDNIIAGESTFLVEMQEAANILNNATNKSLILLDEVGRGTATYDGISIAWGITEHIHNSICAKTLFATHYHELNDMASRYDLIANYRVEVVESGDSVIFTHKVSAGSSDHSFGIHVAQMAGLPMEVIARANELMKNFEDSSQEIKTDDVKIKKSTTEKIETKKSKRIPEQLSIFEFRDDHIREEILKLDINRITPIDALQILSSLHKEAKK